MEIKELAERTGQMKDALNVKLRVDRDTIVMEYNEKIRNRKMKVNDYIKMKS